MTPIRIAAAAAAIALLAPGFAFAEEPTYSTTAFCAWPDASLRVVIVPPPLGPAVVQEDDLETDPGHPIALPDDARPYAEFLAAEATTSYTALPDGADPLWASSTARAAVDASEAWERAMRAYAAANPQAAHLAEVTIETILVSPDASPADWPEADVLVVFSPTLGTLGGVTTETCKPVREGGTVIAMSTLLHQSFTANDVHNIVLHEMGHALGLQHIDTPSGDNMASVYPYPVGLTSTPRECASTLALAQLGSSFAWLAGAPYQLVPPGVEMPASAYAQVC